MGVTWRRGNGHIIWTSKIVKRWGRRRTSYRDGGGHVWRKSGGNRKLEEVETRFILVAGEREEY